MTCSRVGRVQPAAICPEHGGEPPYWSGEYYGNCHSIAAEVLDHMSYGCLDENDFDMIGKVLMDGLEAWAVEADRRAKIENKEQET